eukprot:766647-Hanusia_phi.AAC.4
MGVRAPQIDLSAYHPIPYVSIFVSTSATLVTQHAPSSTSLCFAFAPPPSPHLGFLSLEGPGSAVYYPTTTLEKITPPPRAR